MIIHPSGLNLRSGAHKEGGARAPLTLHPVSCVMTVSSTVDADIPKLPKYVFRRANGSYRYKRNVPKALREVIPKATVYRQLGNSYDEAIRRLPVVHAEVEALFDQERSTPNSVRAKGSVANFWSPVVLFDSDVHGAALRHLIQGLSECSISKARTIRNL